MICSQGIYWFYLEWYVYLKISNERAILYNTLDSSSIIVENESILSFLSLVEGERKNGGLKIDFYASYNTHEFDVFFSNVRMKFMGDLVEDKYFHVNPFQLPPTLKIKNDFRKTKEFPGFTFVQNSLFKLNLYICSDCMANCANCQKTYHQILTCRKFGRGECLSISNIDKLLNTCQFDNLMEINILGGCVSSYYDLHGLFAVLERHRGKCFAYYNLRNVNFITKEIKDFFQDRIVLVVNAEDLERIKILSDYENYKIIFVVEKESDYERIQCLDSVIKYDIYPCYTGCNYSFFFDYVFLEEVDVLSRKQDYVDIYRNQTLNSNAFGELSVFPNGDIYSNVNLDSLGNINKTSIFEIIGKCLQDDGSIWFFTRNQTSCKTCIFSDLCPPISNYELLLGKSDLCKLSNIKKGIIKE